MVVPHSGRYPHAKFERNLLLFKFGPLTKSRLTIPQCAHGHIWAARTVIQVASHPGSIFLRNACSIPNDQVYLYSSPLDARVCAAPAAASWSWPLRVFLVEASALLATATGATPAPRALFSESTATLLKVAWLGGRCCSGETDPASLPPFVRVLSRVGTCGFTRFGHF